MQLLELYHKVEDLKCNYDRWFGTSLVGLAEGLAEKKKEEKRVVERFEKAKVGIENFEELFNRLSEALSANYINVGGVKFSLSLALWYLEKEKEANKPKYTPPMLYQVPEKNDYAPRLAMLNHMDNAALYLANNYDEDEDEEMYIVNPYNLDESVGYKSEFLLKLKTAVYSAMAEIEVK